MEFAETDIKKILKSSMHLEMNHIKTIVYNILQAVNYLNECNVIHRDLKPANILVNEDCSVKLCDFGLSRTITGVETVKQILKETEIEEEEETKNN